MKKFLLSFALFTTSAAYVVYQYMGGTTAVAPVPQQPAVPVSTVTQSPQPIVSAPSNPEPTPTPPSKLKGQYVDGTYTGSAADAYYGTIQVQAIVQAGKLADVTFLQYPNDRRTSQYINSQTMPLLRQEAIQAQSANVSGVSGASDTSVAFTESLSTALAQAKS